MLQALASPGKGVHLSFSEEKACLRDLWHICIAACSAWLWLQALKKVPEVNASWNTEYIRQYHSIDISVAVQTPGGLMVPIVHDADALGLSDISAKVKDLATKVSRVCTPFLAPQLCASAAWCAGQAAGSLLMC